MRFDNFSLKKYNTFGIDVEARHFFSYDTDEELVEFLLHDFDKSLPYFILGGGSNLLLTGAYEGTIIHPETKGIVIIKEDADTVFVSVAAGEIWDDFVAWAVSHNFYGIENLSYIPGTVGASPVQNIGAYGAEAGDCISSVVCLSIDSAQEVILSKEDCHFGYRDSVFKHEKAGQYIVTHVIFKLSKKVSFNIQYGSLSSHIDAKTATLQTVRDTIIQVRKNKLPDPLEIGSAGSFFKNPVISEQNARELLATYPNMVHYPTGDGFIKIAAGWLIDSLGLRGYQYGGAQVYEKQALVLVNTGSATGSDVVHLSQYIQDRVKEVYGIDISPEVIFIP